MDELEAKKYESRQYLLTHVRHEDKWFMVSTINRLSSCERPIEISETMAWEWFPDEKKRGHCVWEIGGYAGSSTQHFLCTQILLVDGHMGNYDCEGKRKEVELL